MTDHETAGTVRLGRWEDTLPGTYDPALVVVVTDPPYGLAAGGGIGVRSPGSHNRPGVVPYLWQGWAVYGRLQIDRHKRAPTGDAYASTFLLQRDPRDHRPRTDHRAITPYASAAWMVDTWVDPGCLVLDPFAGLGTIGLAARMLGFDYLGSEAVPEYAKVANDALAVDRPTLGLGAA